MLPIIPTEKKQRGREKGRKAGRKEVKEGGREGGGVEGRKEGRREQKMFILKAEHSFQDSVLHGLTLLPNSLRDLLKPGNDSDNSMAASNYNI